MTVTAWHELPAGTQVRVDVPATSANLGPGYDCLGLALDIRDVIDVTVLSGLAGRSPSHVTVTGEGAGIIPEDDTHLVLRVLGDVLAARGIHRPTVEMRCINRIPQDHGLGSSAAAVVAGIVAADGLARQAGAEPIELVEQLDLAANVEGHPDNAAPALLGSATISWFSSGAHASRLDVVDGLPCSVVVPTERLATSVARAALPPTVPHADAAFNAARAALLVHALTRAPDLLYEATEDRLHQGYRRSVLPGSMRLVDTLRQASLAAVLSGAGPCVLVLGSDADTVRLALPGIDATVRNVGVADSGATIR